MFVRLFVFALALMVAACRTPQEPNLVASPAELANLAKEAVSVAQRDFQTALDYTDESIRRVEELAVKQGSLPDDQRERFALLWGAYIGEVAKRHHGAEWQADGTLKFGDILLSPRDKVYKRLTNGEEDNLYFYYQTTFNPDKLKVLDITPK